MTGLVRRLRTVELFAGPGGWSEALRMLGITDAVGIEKDPTAYKTATAAGHKRVCADVALLDPAQFAPTRVLIGSPPCPPFSRAGKRQGVLDLPQLYRILDDVHAVARHHGPDAAYRALCDHLEGEAGQWHDDDSRLVLEPVRWALRLLPEAVALEQVPDVLPFWHRVAALLETLGYSATAGLLSAERYGVPQTRRRAILAASRIGKATLPPATHHAYDRDATDEPGLFELPLLPWVSMADALGWGPTSRPGLTVTSGGTATGGAEPFGTQARASLEREREKGFWCPRVPASKGPRHD